MQQIGDESKKIGIYHAVEDVFDCSIDIYGWEVLQDVADGSGTIHEPHIIFTATSRWEETKIKDVDVKLRGIKYMIVPSQNQLIIYWVNFISE